LPEVNQEQLKAIIAPKKMTPFMLPISLQLACDLV
jgi:hypothetical protein